MPQSGNVSTIGRNRNSLSVFGGIILMTLAVISSNLSAPSVPRWNAFFGSMMVLSMGPMVALAFQESSSPGWLLDTSASLGLLA